MQTVAVINCLGGVGRTAVTTNLAGELVLRGKNVLLLGADAQAGLTGSFVTRYDRDTNDDASPAINLGSMRSAKAKSIRH